ncbi:MAG: NAD(P)/FAD-dependent oxidoreductase, partial [Rubrobacter sp.]|nr:NAD(P)/FAD-dependent oxidoreductase [Rubrobacter sp.]
MRVIVVGAGLAGLTCAKVLAGRGAEVSVFEASDGVGGRVRTDRRDGFLLDRGFQVYFTAYPASKRHLDYAALDFQAFDPGAVIRRGAREDVLSDPWRDPGAILASLLSGVATPGDKLRTLALAAGSAFGAPARAGTAGEIEDRKDPSSVEYLRGFGFSERFIDGFFRPFYGGIFLDRSLGTSSRV